MAIYGGGDLASRAHDTKLLNDLKKLSQKKRVFETANPDIPLLQSIVYIANKIPDLTIVIDHLPNINLHSGNYKEFMDVILSIRTLDNIYVKMSETVQNNFGSQKFNYEIYKDIIGIIIDNFGNRRILFESDYPTSNVLGSYDQIIKFAKKISDEMNESDKNYYFKENALSCYSLSR